MGWSDSIAKANQKKNIFISYRVHDTAGETGRLVDSLKQYFEEDQIFMDIDKIEPGVDFTEVISRSLTSCDVMLAIIGPNWLGAREGQAISRIQQQNDWVRLEISTALQRNIRVVPVLVDGAELPSENDLPDDLHPLVRRQAYEISNKRWRYDSEQLVRFLVKQGIQPKPSLFTSTQRKATQRSWWSVNSWWVFIVAGFMLAIVIGISISDQEQTGKQVTPGNNTQFINSEVPEVDGSWNALYTNTPVAYKVSQHNNKLSVSIINNNQMIGNGEGNIENRNVTMEVIIRISDPNTGEMHQIPGTLNLKLSPSGQNLDGTLTMQGLQAQPIFLQKSE